MTPESHKTEFRQLCRDSQLTQAEIASALGVSRRILQYWLAHGRHAPPAMALMAVRYLTARMELEGAYDFVTDRT